jgi:type III secretion protein J
MRPFALVIALVLSACSTRIQHGLDERDANEVVTALVARGLDARKVPEKGKKPTWAIELDDGKATEAMRVLTELKLPRPHRLKTQALAQASGLIDTPAAERLRQWEAREGDLEETLESLDGVTSAAVELVVPLPTRPGLSPLPSKASVLLRARADAMSRLQAQKDELRALVAAGVDGLHADEVVVVFAPVPLEAKAPTPAGRDLRPLVGLLSALVTLLAGALVVLGWRLRRALRVATPGPMVLTASAPANEAPPTPRPVINPSIQRKVA